MSGVDREAPLATLYQAARRSYWRSLGDGLSGTVAAAYAEGVRDSARAIGTPIDRATQERLDREAHREVFGGKS